MTEEQIEKLIRPPMTEPTIRVGAKIRFFGEKRPYTIRAANRRFAVCTKPFNLKRTVLYTVIDIEQGVRGTENLVFGFGAETDQQCEEMLARLAAGETEVSHRNRVRLEPVGPVPMTARPLFTTFFSGPRMTA